MNGLGLKRAQGIEIKRNEHDIKVLTWSDWTHPRGWQGMGYGCWYGCGLGGYVGI